jgi:LuxR family maltose regulon positive regulatory protein
LATTAASRTSGAVADLVLKVTPPRVPRDLLVRARLRADAEQFRGYPAICVQAPAGFGKTLMLAQWRREFLAHGAVVAWLSAQEQDDVQRFVQSLALAVRIGAGRPTFGHTLLEAAPNDLEGVTAWLAELAQSALDVVLIVDTAERLSADSREALTYVLHNAPSNLRVVVAARSDCDLGVEDLVTYGQCVALGTAALRFRLDETIALVRARFGASIDADTCARLHELTEGWPLGLQLALAAIARGADPRAAANAMAAHSGELHNHLVGVLLANLDPEDATFLARIAIVDEVHPDLSRALTGATDAAERLARLARETPLFAEAESSEWLRMHALARDVLRARLEASTPDERARLHERASEWFAAQDLLEDAARHALAADKRELAYDLAERCLYEALTTRGHVGAVLELIGNLPAAELNRRPRLLLAAAWALAVSERHREAEMLVARILEHAGDDQALLCECALIRGGAAVFADDPDCFVQLHAPWSVEPPLAEPLLRHMHANRTAFRALLEGDPAQARRYQQQAPRVEFGNAFGLVARWGEFITALSYFWEGQVLLTENLLRPALASAEADLGRRNPFVCSFAALLAAAVWERDQPADAVALLANRLDVLEKGGLPEAVLLAYRTGARIAVAEGAEHRGHELLEAMYAVGVARNLPRLCIASLSDQVRMHARRFRRETCRSLCDRIDAILARDDVPKGPLWRRGAELLQLVAHANAAIAAQEWRRAVDPLTRAGNLAESMRLGRVRIEMMALRAFALDRSGEKSVALLQESIDLARTYGLARLFADAHPALDDWAHRSVTEPTAASPVRPVAVKVAQPERSAPVPRANPSMALTPKEREVLELLARNLSNKEIALAMQIGEETIKWHLKNLFGKLDAGTRKQVVRRAQLLGLLEQPAA